MLWENEAKPTTNPPPSVGLNLSNAWKPLGNGQEVLTKAVPVKADTEDPNVVVTKHEEEKVVAGDLVFLENKWVEVDEVKENKLVLRQDNKKVETEATAYHKRIPIQILVCTTSSQFVCLIELNGRTKLSSLSKKLSKRAHSNAQKADWYFNGKNVDETSTIESLGLKPKDKLACMVLGYDIKTYKRFTRLDNRGWYLSRSSKDSITFIPSKAILLFGFGMYYTREGPPSYTMGYELYLDEDSRKEAVLTITKPSEDDEVYPIYFDPNQTPILVSAGTKISIVVHYEDYNDSSRLRVGTDGRNHESAEGNEQGLFTVEEHSDSGNGTDVGSGQIPELYYSLAQ